MTGDEGLFLREGTALLQHLLEIQSPSGEEAAAVDFLVDWMNEHGFAAHRDHAGNAIGILEAASGEAPSATRDLVLLGHIDTVGGFPPVDIRDGRLYGRGAVDAKGPLSAFAVSAALAGAQPGWRIIVIGAVEEEAATSKGARHVVTQYDPTAVVIGEPTGWARLALGYKGRLLAEVSVRQPMAHRAGPSATAPERAIAFWNALRGEVEALNAGRERTWEQVQANLRSFSAQDDGIEELAELSLGFRLPLHLTPDDLKATVRGLANGHHLRFSGEECAFKASKNNALVRAFLGSIRAAGGEPSFVVKTGTSDMNVVGPAWGCPIIAYGPGDSALDHTPEEHVQLVEWGRGVRVLSRAIRSLTSAP